MQCAGSCLDPSKIDKVSPPSETLPFIVFGGRLFTLTQSENCLSLKDISSKFCLLIKQQEDGRKKIRYEEERNIQSVKGGFEEERIQHHLMLNRSVELVREMTSTAQNPESVGCQNKTFVLSQSLGNIFKGDGIKHLI